MIVPRSRCLLSRSVSTAPLAAPLAALALLLGAAPSPAQETATIADAWQEVSAVRPLPPGRRTAAADPVPAAHLSLPTLDTAAFLAEAARLPAFPQRTGSVLPADLVLGSPGDAWQAQPDGSFLLRVVLDSPGAAGLRLRFDAPVLPQGGELWVLDANGQVASGPWAPPAPGWTPVVDGARVVLELLLPPGSALARPLRIADVLVMALNPGAALASGAGTPGAGPAGVGAHGPGAPAPDAPPGTQTLGSCHVDVMCHPEWHPLHNATVHIDSIDGSTGLGCSATLLATQNGDLTPYLLTANHCVSNEFVADTLAARFFRQTTSCGGALDVQQTAAAADVLATTAVWDMTLLMLHGPLPEGAVWAGWTTVGLPAAAELVGIHHPGGQPKKISLGHKSILNLGNTLYTVEWDEGTIEGGSSGSGLYKAVNQLFIGVASVSSTPLGCTNPDGPSGYGKFKDWYAADPLVAGYFAAGTDDAFEPNDSCAAAVPLPLGRTTGLVVKSLDEDHFAVTLGSQGSLAVTLGALAAYGDVDLELRDGCSGALLAATSGAADLQQLAWTNDTGSTRDLVLRVFLVDDVRADYTLDVTFDPGDPGFFDVGPGLPGSAGTPTLGGAGDLSPGGSGFTVSVANALPFAPGYVFLSFVGNPQPFLGGSFYPWPIHAQQVLGMDASGGLTIATSIDASFPSGISAVLQYWFLDAAGPQGASASNGLRLVVP